ncbi:MAG: tripartite tricarboxylate transporter substrate binding protein [Rhodoferax sp.]|nr:tripartite tricarboxylate transporter substrate binding protein [Rhodoferax sp.]
MHPTRRHFATLMAAVGATSVWPLRAQQQPEYPSRPIRYVVPFPAGGLTDVMARMVAQKLTESLKQPVVVDNKPGANANLGADIVAKASADGYTWLAVTLTHAVNPALFPALPYSLDKNLTAVAHLATSPLVLVVNANTPVKNLREFLERAQGRSLSGGSSGNGTPPHLGLELLAGSAKLNFLHVPYKGGTPSLNDLMGGQIEFIVSNLPECSALVKAGKLRALAITSQTRHALLPEVPTFAELGLADVVLENWTGLMMPAGTPAQVVDKVAQQAIRAVTAPDVSERLGALGFSVTGLGPAEFATILQRDMARWREVVKARRIHAD